MYEYSIRSGSVRFVAPLPQQRPHRACPRVSDFACLVWEGSVYLFGGVESGPDNRQLTTNLVFRLSLRDALETAGASPSWTVLPSMDERRHGGAAVGAEGKIWVIGGRPLLRGGPHTDAVERFDPQGNTWERMPPLVRNRAYCSAVSVASSIYAVGGCECPFLTMERLHLDEPPVWELITFDTRLDQRCAVVAVAPNIYVFGGWTELGPTVGTSAASIDVDTMECKQLPIMPASHDYFGQAVTLDNSIYLFGGTPDGDVSKFDNLSGSWKRLPNSDIISQVCYAGCLLPHSGDARSASEAPSLSEGFGLLLSERQPQEARTAQTHHGLAIDPDEVIQLVQHWEPPCPHRSGGGRHLRGRAGGGPGGAPRRHPASGACKGAPEQP